MTRRVVSMNVARLDSALRHRWRFGIGAKLRTVLVGAVLFTLVASVISWIAFLRIEERGSEIVEEGIPYVLLSSRMAEESLHLVSGIPQLLAVESEAQMEAISVRLRRHEQNLEALLEQLKEHNSRIRERDMMTDAVMMLTGDERALHEDQAVRSHRQMESIFRQFKHTLRQLEQSMHSRLRLGVQFRKDIQLLDGLGGQIDDLLIPAVDDRLFFLHTGLVDFKDQEVAAQSRYADVYLNGYRGLSQLASDGNRATGLLSQLSFVNDAAVLSSLEGVFKATKDRIYQSLRLIDQETLGRQLRPLLEQLVALGLSDESMFGVRRQMLLESDKQAVYLQRSRQLTQQLATEVDKMESLTQVGIERDAQDTSMAIQRGTQMLVGLNVISLMGTLLISWLFIGRQLLPRLHNLSGAMRDMAGGDLEARVPTGGNDEITDMAKALEVFRRHALEVQRLNLVEKQAQELEKQRRELEEALEELQRTQNRMIIQEKLASMGQLTAGIAHEIKNPLNFVNNFAALSAELLDEMNEEVEAASARLEEEERQAIAELIKDIRGNMVRIRDHGRRADSIVRNMLLHAREGRGDLGQVDLNALIREYLLLAYHSVRATNKQFNVSIEQELDSELGEVEVVAQDLSRVLLNIFINAFQALDECGQDQREGAKDEGWKPCLQVSSASDGEDVVVQVRDNGPGMPPEIAQRVFEPFFTTKDAGEGTGLGLSMSYDIISGYGGSLSLDTEPGQYTSFTIRLPRSQSPD